MRVKTGRVAFLAEAIEKDLIKKFPKEKGIKKIDKRTLASMADCISCALTTHSVNTGEWNAVAPRDTSKKKKERWISGVLASAKIVPHIIMQVFATEIINILSRKRKTIILMIDQSQINDDFQCLMVSVRFGERALPVAWIVKETKGSIGFEEQEALLNKVLEMIPEGTKILLAGDRFYGTKALVEWCQKAMWQYRIRLKGNLIFQHEGGEIRAEEVRNLPGSKAVNAKFNDSSITTNIGYLQEENHEEPWIIAMDCEPNKYKVLDYSMRWGIECMFSDFKSRGFGITNTHLVHSERIENLILILTIAMYWAVSVGTTPGEDDESEKRVSEKKAYRSKLSFFTSGLRLILAALVSTSLSFSHVLWGFL